jgi:hypothetical protein
LQIDEKELGKLLFAVGFSFLEKTFSKSVDLYFGTEMCNALGKYNNELRQDRTYFKDKSDLYRCFSRFKAEAVLEELEELEDFDNIYKAIFTEYLESLNVNSQEEKKRNAELKKSTKNNFFKTFFSRFQRRNTAHTMIISFMKKAFEAVVKGEESLIRNVAEKIKPLIEKMKSEKLDMKETYDLVFTVLAEILHCPIELWRIENPLEEDGKIQYFVSSYGTDTIFRSHLAFLKMNAAGDKKLLILYDETLGVEMELEAPKGESLEKCKVIRKLKLETNNYLDYCIDKCTEALDKVEVVDKCTEALDKVKVIDSLLEEIKTYSEQLGKKLENEDIKELQRFIVDVNKLNAKKIKKDSVLDVPKCMACKGEENLIAFGCGKCYICKEDGDR